MFTPNRLETALYPSEVTLKAIVPKFAKKAEYSGRFRDSDGVGVIDKDTRGGTPCGEAGASGVRG